MAAAFASSILVLSIAPNYLVYSLLLPICGVTALVTMITANTTIQTKSDASIRGRVTGLYLLIFMGGTPFGSPLIGWAAEHIGTRQTIALCASIALVAIITIWTIYRDRVEAPTSIAVESVLESAYEDKS